MRARLLLLTMAVLAAACSPELTRAVADAAAPDVAAVQTTPTTSPPPPPPPDHCSDYAAMERGDGHPANQAWFNELPARHGDKGYARLVLACVYQGGGDEFAALDELWQREADGGDDTPHGDGERAADGGTWWNDTGHDWHPGNPPQAKPYSKMGCAQADDRCKVRWGLRYIAERYGSPSSAWRAWRARSPHWY